MKLTPFKQHIITENNLKTIYKILSDISARVYPELAKKYNLLHIDKPKGVWTDRSGRKFKDFYKLQFLHTTSDMKKYKKDGIITKIMTEKQFIDGMWSEIQKMSTKKIQIEGQFSTSPKQDSYVIKGHIFFKDSDTQISYGSISRLKGSKWKIVT